MDNRKIRARAIISKGDVPTVISREEFVMPSQSGNGKYKILHKEEWECNCPDFKKRGKPCKHIIATQFWLRMREKAETGGTFELENEIIDKDNCPYCHSENIVKNGDRKIKNGESRQRFLCRDCKKRFVLDPLKGFKGNGKIITLALDLFFKGLSLRKIIDTINQFYGLKLHHETVRRWIMKFTKVMNDYVSKYEPKLSETWHIDEQFVKTRTGSGDARGNYAYAWNVLDADTRFLITSKLTQFRSRTEARETIKEAKNGNREPKTIVTDKLNAYKYAIRDEFPNAKHIIYRGFKDGTQNNKIERFHGTFRERDKVMRGLKSVKTAQNFVEAFRNYYNFLRPHQTLGMTPAQATGIELGLKGNRWLSIISKAEACKSI